MAESKKNIQFFLKDFIVAGIAGSLSNILMNPIFNLKLSIDNSMMKKTRDSIAKLSFISHTLKLIKD